MRSWHSLPLLAALLAVLLQPGWAHASVENNPLLQKEGTQNTQRPQSRAAYWEIGRELVRIWKMQA